MLPTITFCVASSFRFINIILCPVCAQAALGPNIVTESRDVLEGAEHLLFVKTYCPYGTFEGRLRDLGVAKARSVA